MEDGTMLCLPDRRFEAYDRRADDRGGRRLTDQRPDIAHGVPCNECDTGIASLVHSDFRGRELWLMYRCHQCGLLQELATDRFHVISGGAVARHH